MNTAFTALPDIISMGDKIFEPHWAVHNHQSGHCELLLVMEGWVRTVFYRRRSFTTAPGSFVLIPAGIRHRDEFDLALGMKVFMVVFRWQHDREYFQRLPLDVCRAMPPAARRSVAALCDQLRDRLAAGADADRLLARAHLLTILFTVLHALLTRGSAAGRPAAAGRNNHSRTLMLQARAYLDAHYAAEISLEQIARHLRISPFYLSHLFSRENDFSLLEYLTNRRMQQAKLLLQSGKHSIKEAAHAVGYHDGNYFSKVFHRHFGFAPRDLRYAARS